MLKNYKLFKTMQADHSYKDELGPEKLHRTFKNLERSEQQQQKQRIRFKK